MIIEDLKNCIEAILIADAFAVLTIAGCIFTFCGVLPVFMGFLSGVFLMLTVSEGAFAWLLWKMANDKEEESEETEETE